MSVCEALRFIFGELKVNHTIHKWNRPKAFLL